MDNKDYFFQYIRSYASSGTAAAIALIAMALFEIAKAIEDIAQSYKHKL